jgi:hypothetical protein
VRSVLLGRDQDRGVLPDHCVVTGVRTAGAIRVRATPRWLPELVADALGPLTGIGRRVALPVDADALRPYRRRQAGWSLPAGAGIGIALFGAVPLGIALVVLGVAGSMRTRRRDWVQVRTAPNGDDVIVLRGSRAFDEDAQRLFTASLRP